MKGGVAARKWAWSAAALVILAGCGDGNGASGTAAPAEERALPIGEILDVVAERLLQREDGLEAGVIVFGLHTGIRDGGGTASERIRTAGPAWAEFHAAARDMEVSFATPRRLAERGSHGRFHVLVDLHETQMKQIAPLWVDEVRARGIDAADVFVLRGIGRRGERAFARLYPVQGNHLQVIDVGLRLAENAWVIEQLERIVLSW